MDKLIRVCVTGDTWEVVLFDEEGMEIVELDNFHSLFVKQYDLPGVACNTNTYQFVHD